ncbi:hypothetical protein EVAR_85975_1 [Eumeta japonica]|uniref:Uncharacterized protein n=1 Tax=Eumeta variegata TaxID=151549 RepID=A0A4C1UJ19_EUMVA|nr:hypothetical protein EVAR_85975_1 [Eumeta japonica]
MVDNKDANTNVQSNSKREKPKLPVCHQQIQFTKIQVQKEKPKLSVLNHQKRIRKGAHERNELTNERNVLTGLSDRWRSHLLGMASVCFIRTRLHDASPSHCVASLSVSLTHGKHVCLVSISLIILP